MYSIPPPQLTIPLHQHPPPPMMMCGWTSPYGSLWREWLLLAVVEECWRWWKRCWWSSIVSCGGWWM